MTLVKQLNMDEVLECVCNLRFVYMQRESVNGWPILTRVFGRYVALVKRGSPDFIEIKGVTFCGGSRSELSMSNVPWHEEVCSRVDRLLGSA